MEALITRRLALGIIGASALPTTAAGWLQDSDDKFAKKVEKLDAQLVKALTDLAKKYDEDKIPEAAHLLASCAVGFGSKDSKIAAIRGGWEVDLFVGKVRGGEVLADANPINTALRGIAYEYKKFLEPLLAPIKKGELSEAVKKLVHESVPKYEIARGAHEYIQATQRFNKLRRAMGLRAILWDFDTSRRLILACWYMGETGDYQFAEQSDTLSALYSPGVELAKQRCAGMVDRALRDFPEDIRSFALVRQDLLNPNARQLWLGHWGGGKKIDPMSVYAIPQDEFRKDIPTPTQRYSGETVVESWPQWVDTEDTICVNERKVPFVRYPHAGELDTPRVFSNGKGALEFGWVKGEHAFLKHAGVPIMIRFFSAGSLSDLSFELLDKAGRPEQVRVYTNGDPRVEFKGGWPSVLILPEKQLDPGKEYTVKLACKLESSPFEKSWSFRTRSD